MADTLTKIASGPCAAYTTDKGMVFNFFYSLLLLRTPVSARSYRASVFLLDYVLCCHCQANKLIQLIHSLSVNVTVVNREPHSQHCDS